MLWCHIYPICGELGGKCPLNTVWATVSGTSHCENWNVWFFSCGSMGMKGGNCLSRLPLRTFYQSHKIRLHVAGTQSGTPPPTGVCHRAPECLLFFYWSHGNNIYLYKFVPKTLRRNHLKLGAWWASCIRVNQIFMAIRTKILIFSAFRYCLVKHQHETKEAKVHLNSVRNPA